MLENWKEKAAGLDEECVHRIEMMEQALPYMAELFGADLFVDCLDRESGRMFVAAQSRPSDDLSAYAELVLGQEASPESEPAVYQALKMNVSVRDIKAVTQENRIVRQSAMPIPGSNGAAAVLIAEQDISRDVHRERKLRAIERKGGVPEASGNGALGARELHHRVKNHLQLLAGMMRMQGRMAGPGAVRDALAENEARLLSMAALHEILTAQSGEIVPLLPLLQRMKENYEALCGGVGVEISVQGDPLLLSQDRATNVAIVVNELITNALLHAFPAGRAGHICVSVSGVAVMATIAVSDDGVGMDASDRSLGTGLGLSIAQRTVRDTLGGSLHFSAGMQGTTVSFDFPV